MRSHLSINIFFLGLFIFSLVLFISSRETSLADIQKQGSITISAKVSVCGNGIVEFNEQCDGTDFGGATCESLGFSGGTLGCTPSCTYDTSNCTIGGGGGGGGGGTITSQTIVNFSGIAYPNEKVTLLKDAQVAATTVAGPDARFQISLTGLSTGNYVFSLYAEDKEGRRSNLFTFPESVTQGSIINITGIFIPPTIDTDKIEVKRGDNITILGQSAPQADILISTQSDNEFFAKTVSDKNGLYSYLFDTSVLDYGTHYSKSKASIGNLAISSYGRVVSFIVGDKNVLKTYKEGVCGKADLNCDGKVNLIDFSIAAYWYKRPLSSEFAVKERERLNGDGKIDLVDFSIMAYYWTG